MKLGLGLSSATILKDFCENWNAHNFSFFEYRPQSLDSGPFYICLETYLGAFQPLILPSQHLLQIKINDPINVKLPLKMVTFASQMLRRIHFKQCCALCPIYWRFSFTEDKMAENYPLLQFIPLKIRDLKEKMLAFTLIPNINLNQSIFEQWGYE